MKPRSLLATLCALAALAACASGPDRFALTDQNGRRVTEADLKGRPTVLAFGFTACPDACPATLAALSADLKALGPDAARLNVVYVTLDPERDTPGRLHAYLTAFDPRIRALTGSPDAVKALADAHDVAFRRAPLPHGDYTIAHTTQVYLLDRQGRGAGALALADLDPKTDVPRLQRLLRS